MKILMYVNNIVASVFYVTRVEIAGHIFKHMVMYDGLNYVGICWEGTGIKYILERDV